MMNLFAVVIERQAWVDQELIGLWLACLGATCWAVTEVWGYLLKRHRYHEVQREMTEHALRQIDRRQALKAAAQMGTRR